MSKLGITTGSSPNDGTGDTLLQGAVKINSNFDEVYTFLGNGSTLTTIANSKLTNSSVSFGGVSVALGSSDATPAFDLSDATNYPTSSLSGTITNAQLAGSISNAKLTNSSVSFGGVSVTLGSSDATPAFDLSDATNYPTSSLSGTITNAQLAGSIADGKLASTFLKSVVEDTTPQLGGNLDANSKNITGVANLNVSGIVTATSLDASISEWVLGANGLSDYTFTGPGLTGAENDPTIYLVRGQKYNFKNNSGGHPFRIQSTPNGSTGTQYNDGITNNDAGNGVTLNWDVQFDAPEVLYYQCTSHASMGGKIYIGNSGESIIVGAAVTINSSGINATGIITATSFTGDGSGLSGIVASGSGVIVKHDGSTVGTAGTINFGTNLDVSPISAGIVTITASGGGGSLQNRTVVSGATTSIENNGIGNTDITGFKSYALMKVGLSTSGWIRLYTDSTSRTNDSSRSVGIDPTPGSGVIAEVVTTGISTTQVITPFVMGGNLNNPSDATIYVAIKNLSGSTQSITANLTILQLEA